MWPIFRSSDVLNDPIPTTLVYPPPLPNSETYFIVQSPTSMVLLTKNNTGRGAAFEML
jgi:hypothetical protein